MLFVSSVTENKQDWIIFDLDWKWPYWLVTLKREKRLSRSRANVQNNLTFTLNNGVNFNTWKRNCSNVWSMKLDVFSERMSYGEIGDYPLSFLYKSFKFSTYNVIQMRFRSWLRSFSQLDKKDINSRSFLEKAEKWPYLTSWLWNLTLKVKCCDGKRVSLRPWTMLILFNMIANL